MREQLIVPDSREKSNKGRAGKRLLNFDGIMTVRARLKVRVKERNRGNFSRILALSIQKEIGQDLTVEN